MQNSLLNRFSDRIPNVVLTNSTPDAYKSNLLAVEVYFDDINFQSIQEVEAYKVRQVYKTGWLFLFVYVYSLFRPANSPAILEES